jgi:hypothetical protein
MSILNRDRATRGISRTLATLGLVGLTSTLAACSAADERLPTESTSTGTQDLYVARVQLWTDNGNVVPICWNDAGWATEKAWVQNAVQAAWGAESNLTFTWTASCPTTGSTRYLKIGIASQAKDAAGNYPNLGADGSSYVGMGDTFRAPSDAPGTNFAFRPDHLANRGRVEYAGVHEIGHALGFPHEQDRPENEGGVFCNSGVSTDKTGSQVGNYDQDSIMNYCNSNGNASGSLSARDRLAVREVYGLPVGAGERQFLAADVNGDLRADMLQTYRGWASIPVCQSNGTSFTCTNRSATIFDPGSAEGRFLTGDFNADGRGDVIQTFRGWHSIPTCNSTGSGWTCRNSAADIYDSGSSEQRFSTGDFNADGRADVFQTFRKWHSIPTCTSTGTGWSCNNYAADIYDSGSVEQQFLTGDFNADGRADVIQTYRGWHSIPTCNSTGSGWTCRNSAADIYDSSSWEQKFSTGDFNHDGRTDVFQTYRKWHSIPTCTSTGTGWSCNNYAADIYDSGSVEQQFLTGDFNGDGRADVVQTFRGWHSIPTCNSTGSGWSCTNAAADIFDSGSVDQRFVAADVNGDGKTDIVQVYRGWSSYPVCFSTGSGWSCSNIPATIF